MLVPKEPRLVSQKQQYSISDWNAHFNLPNSSHSSRPSSDIILMAELISLAVNFQFRVCSSFGPPYFLPCHSLYAISLSSLNSFVMRKSPFLSRPQFLDLQKRENNYLTELLWVGLISVCNIISSVPDT